MIKPEEIQEAVIRCIDMEKLGKTLADRILGDSDFYDKLQERILDRFVGSYASGMSSMENYLITKMSDKFLADKTQEILSKVDMNAVLNAIALRSAKGLGERL
jgi:hypothetical protein